MQRTTRALQRTDRDLLFELRDYPALGSVVQFPIVAVEARTLAHHYPVVWRRSGETFELTALISIASPHDRTLRRDFDLGLSRPLLLEAYPLSIAFPATSGDPGIVMIEQSSAADGATGTPVFLESGAPSAAAAHRLSALEVYAGDFARTAAFTLALAAAGLIIDWPLRLRIGEDGVELEGFCVLAPPPERRERLESLVADHGFSIAELATLHDLSLFNMQRLVDRYRLERALDRAGDPIGASRVEGEATGL